MNKIGNFLKNKNTVTIIGVVLVILIIYIGYTMRINQTVKLVRVYYALDTIQPKTLITDSMIGQTEVPQSFILGKYYRNYNDIVGKYSNYNTMIAAGSLFYEDLLIEEQNLPDAVLYDINAGERLVAFPVTVSSTYGNSIMPDTLIDVYVKMIKDDGKIVYGEFFNKIKVLGVKDSTGNNVFESTDSTRTPAFVYFSLPESKYLLFSALNYIGEEYKAYNMEIVIVPNTVKYESDELATEVRSSDLYQFVLDDIKTIDSQKELYNRLLNEMEQAESQEE